MTNTEEIIDNMKSDIKLTGMNIIRDCGQELRREAFDYASSIFQDMECECICPCEDECQCDDTIDWVGECKCKDACVCYTQCRGECHDSEKDIQGVLIFNTKQAMREIIETAQSDSEDLFLYHIDKQKGHSVREIKSLCIIDLQEQIKVKINTESLDYMGDIVDGYAEHAHKNFYEEIIDKLVEE